MFEVNVAARSVEPFAELMPRDRITELQRSADRIRALLGAGAVWNINSTAAGGGVAEMLHSLVRYSRGLGIQARWLVIDGPPEFFRVTKRVHNALHDGAGDGSPLGPEQTRIFERTLQENAAELDAFIRPGDVAICHDPQTAGLIPHLIDRGAHVVWRCHIGHELRGVEVDRGWAFLRPYVEVAPLAVFSRGAYAPPWLPRARAVVLAPTIDPFSAKNQWMDGAVVRAVLADVGLVEGPPGPSAPVFVRDDGSVGRVDRKAEVLRLGRAPSVGTALVVQVSRWDAMKDPLGVLEGFAHHVVAKAHCNAELVLAGPQMRSVADDPEGPLVFAELEKAWRALPSGAQGKVHLAQLPMDDPEENAAIVNALQRHAAIIVQKSLVEGFGLTVTEGMWKRRPVIASAVGGILDQIDDGLDGILLRDPRDLEAFGAAVCCVLDDEPFANRLGQAAYRRVVERSLSISSLEQWAALVGAILETREDLAQPLQGAPV